MSFSYLMKSSNRYQYNPKIFLEKLNYFPGETIKINIGFSSNGNINLKENPLKINYSIKQIEYWDKNNNINIIEKSNLNRKTISYFSDTPGNPSDFNHRINLTERKVNKNQKITSYFDKQNNNHKNNTKIIKEIKENNKKKNRY